MPNFRTTFFMFIIFISSAVSAGRYKEPSFEIIIPFTKGKILNLDSIKKQNQFMPRYASAASAFNLIFSSPTFYGSFIIDSILSKNRVVHDTYFVDGLGHNFYDKEPYKTNVLKRIIEFLYKLVQ